MSATPFALSTDPSTRIVTMTLEPNQGPMVILDRALIERIEASLRALPSDAAGLILASGSPRVFVAGADLKSIVALSVAELDEYLAFGQRVFGMLCALPFPTVAAINGAALGGGLELAMHCDGLIGAQPGPGGRPYSIGLPEAGLAICPGWGGTNLLPARMDPAEAMRRTCQGRPMMLDEAVSARVLDAVAVEPGALIGVCASWLRANSHAHAARADMQPLRWIGREPRRSGARAALAAVHAELGAADPAASCLRAIEAGLARGWPAALEVERRELNRLRNEPAGQAAIKAFFEKSAKK